MEESKVIIGQGNQYEQVPELQSHSSLKVWKVTDCDWYVASTYEEAAECALADGMDEECVFKYGKALRPYPLTEEELRKMVISDPDDGPEGVRISGWEHLQQIQRTGQDAIFFASTEY